MAIILRPAEMPTMQQAGFLRALAAPGAMLKMTTRRTSTGQMQTNGTITGVAAPIRNGSFEALVRRGWIEPNGSADTYVLTRKGKDVAAWCQP